MWLRGGAIVTLCLVITANAQRVRRCQTPNGETARCLSVYDCDIILSVIYTNNSEQLRFVRESQCGYNQSPLVCCGSSNNFVKRNTAVAESSNSGNKVTPRNNNIPNRSACGFQETERIFNGETTNLDEFPWMALLQYSNASGYTKFSCGGSLITPRYVLTAAHCVTGDVARKVGNLVNVRLGEWDTRQNVDCVESAGIQICNKPPVDVGIEEIIFHPSYDNNDLNRHNDIALVRLNRKVTYTNFIRAICLPLPTEASNAGEKVTIAGWGKTEKLKSSPIKMKLGVPITNKSQCVSTFRTAGVRIDNTQICAGGEAGKDSCTGDSGGPLMATINNESLQWYVEGIVSFGADCGTPGWPGVYTKVSAHLDWIYKTIRS